MRSSEYFQGNTEWPEYPLKGVGSVRADEHPLSEGPYKLKPGTEFIQVYTYLGNRTITETRGDQRPFWEQAAPSKIAVGPVISMDEYEEVIQTVAADFKAGAVPLSAEQWSAHPDMPFVQSSTLHAMTQVEVPTDPTDHQLRATTVIEKKGMPGVPSYRGTRYTKALQELGFPPDSFWHISKPARRMEIGHRLLRVATLGLVSIGNAPTAVIFEAAGKAADAGIKHFLPQGVLKEQIRTSRHR